MPRRQARIGHDEVARLIKAVLSSGQKIDRVIYDGEKVSVVVWQPGTDRADKSEGPYGKPLREPVL